MARAAVDRREIDGWRGCEGGDFGGRCLWREAGWTWKQGDTAESCVVGSGGEPSL